MGKGQKLYIKAKSIVAGDNMLLSKRPEMFLPEKWPSYFSKTQGLKIAWVEVGIKKLLKIHSREDMVFFWGINLKCNSVASLGIQQKDWNLSKTYGYIRVIINRPPRDGHMAFVRSPEGISIEILQEGDNLSPQEPWLSMENTGTW